MTLDEKFGIAKALTAKWGQGHLLGFYDGLSPVEKEALLDSILAMDFALIHRLYKGAAEPAHAADDTICPIVAVDKAGLTADDIARAVALGRQAIVGGQYAVVTMAGGQGSRLGHDGPKGTYRMRLDREKTIFEVQLERIVAASCAAGRTLPWYIMTSAENHAATVEFFGSHNNFGYPDITFFQQGSLPMVGMDGRILLEEKHRPKEGPDGNGSIFRVMEKTGVADDMRRRGVRWFFVCNVDNILARSTDPLPIGLAIERGAHCVSKSVMKRSPGEKAGVFCLKGGHPGVIEYTEVSAELANQRDDAGSFVYGDAHISCTLFHIDVLDLEGAKNMPYHTAVKKAAVIGPDGAPRPQKEDAYKFEAFIFDIFPFIDDLMVLRIDRDEEFAPIKNAEGEDSPQTARESYLKNMMN